LAPLTKCLQIATLFYESGGRRARPGPSWKRYGSLQKRGRHLSGRRSALGVTRSVCGCMQGAIPRMMICCVSQGSDPPSIHARFGDGLDGRRQIGRNPAEGDVGSADAPRELRQAPPTYEPDEARGPVLGEKTLPFLAGEAELVDRRLVHVVLVRAITSRHDGPCSGSGGAWVMRIAPSSACSVGGQQPCRPRGSLPRQESSARSTTSRSRSWQRHDAAAGVGTIA